jgi:capsular polysaccharide transport system ATP-binding protein
MIELQSVSKSYKSATSRKVILEDCSFALPLNRSLAVLGQNGAGKSTLLRLLSGAETPDRGKIIRKNLRVSWTMGLSSGFQSSLTGRDNARFVARLYGANPSKVVDYVEDFAELGDYLTMPVKTYSSGMKARLAFGLSMAIEFDLYLIDEIISVGDARFKAKSLALFKEKAGHARFIMVSHSKQTLQDYCDCSVRIKNGRLIYHDSLTEGIKAYEGEMSQ